MNARYRNRFMAPIREDRNKGKKEKREADIKRIIALYTSDLKISEIANELGLTEYAADSMVQSLIKSGVLKRRAPRRDSNSNKRFKEIKALLLKGETFGRIVSLLNDPDVTRNVVCGIYSRHIKKIQPRDSCVKAKDRANQGGIASIIDNKKNRVSTGIPISKYKLENDNRFKNWSLKGSDIHLSDGPVLLEDIENGCCHYPVGDTFPIRFCGLPREGDRNYCPQHAAIVRDTSNDATKLIKETSRIPRENRILRRP